MITFDDRGLLTAVVQDARTKEVLMVAHMNREALKRTIAGPHVWFYSRSRKSLWEKGSTSGDYLDVVDLQLDCDGDALLVHAKPAGAACHTGQTSCFHASLDPTYDSTNRIGPGILFELADVIRQRAIDLPEGSYTAKLIKAGPSRIAQKVIEEAGETGLAAATGAKDQVPLEMADLIYNCLTLLESVGVSIEEVWAELAKRRL
ncbi:MAG: bifunctional phosphoribosyl-AMP cyclohydrolase/phosphoribosyl-ATP diphosphatase HisIE [Chloroflexi bacterium]|nr:bifunctional phosphoribosyl-AMP cyclohydrolase/phosphoribosyl-ATP diphosphatase HisIE [Chloroflexota bacterium]